MLTRPLLGVAALLALPIISLAQVKDINPNPVSPAPILHSNPSHSRLVNHASEARFLRSGNTVFFTASTPDKGRELWSTTTTAKGVYTKRLTDLNPGPNNSNPYSLTLFEGKIYFRAYTPKTGYEAFVYDLGTKRAKLFADFKKGPASSSPFGFAGLSNGKIVCSANSGKGYEPHVSDGTIAGTKQLRDIYAGNASSSPSYLVGPRYSGSTSSTVRTIFFSARSPISGTELWKTDGTPYGTRMVKDIQTGTGSSYPRYMHQATGTTVVFQAYSSKTGTELWSSDGTAANTKVIELVAGPGSGLTSLFNSATIWRKELLYVGITPSTGSELFHVRFDARPFKPRLVRDLSPGRTSTTFHQISCETQTGPVFIALSTSAKTTEIWMSIGSPGSTWKIAISPGSMPNHLSGTVHGVYWSANVPGKGRELCYYISRSRTTGVLDLYPGSLGSYPTYGTSRGSSGREMTFRARSKTKGYEPHFITGTSVTNIDLAKATGPVTQNDRVNSITELFGKVIFSATDGKNGSELWASDGTPSKTTMVKDIRAGASSGVSPYNMHATRLGNYVYFAANDGVKGTELWRSDGKPGGTRLFVDLASGASSSSPTGMTRIGTKIYFSANIPGKGRELCVTNGSWVKVIDVYRGTASSNPTQFAQVSYKNTVLFTARGPKGYELYGSTGTNSFLVKDIYAGAGSSSPMGLTTWKGSVYFSAYTSANGRELWRTYGTGGTTVLFKNLASDTAGRQSSNPRDFAANSSKIPLLYFTAYTDSQLTGLWRSGGTSTSTTPYFNFPYDLRPGMTTAVGSRNLYFRGNSMIGQTLLRHDPAGIQVFRQTINPKGHAWPLNYTNGRGQFCVEGGAVWFSATKNVILDQQLFRTAAHGATATEIGEVRGKASLHCTDPRLGKTMKISGQTLITTPVNVLLLSIPTQNPLPFGAFSLYYDPSVMVPLATLGGRTWSINVPVPSTPSLKGKQVILQNWGLNATTYPAGSHLSNGIHLTFGN